MPYTDPKSETARANKRRTNAAWVERQLANNPDRFRETQRAQSRAYRERHPERSREASRRGAELYRQRYPEKSNASLRASALRHRYGITQADFDALFLKQKGLCAICGTSNPGTRRFHVDHCHDTGKIRGLLCHNCNLAIGHFKDNIETMSNAMKYVRNGGA